MLKWLNESHYFDVKCCSDTEGTLGSMFVVIRDEEESKCEYKIVNESKAVDLLYYQHIDAAKVPQRLAGLNLSKYVQRNRRLKSGQSYRYSWGSVLHDRLLCVSFTPTAKTRSNEKYWLGLADPGAQQRQLSKTDLVVPLE